MMKRFLIALAWSLIAICVFALIIYDLIFMGF